MGMIDDIAEKLGGKQGQESGLASLQKLLNSSGGLQGLAQKLSNGGLAEQVQSWINSGGYKQPVNGDQIQHHMDQNELGNAANQAGMSREQTADNVAQALPHVVDRATPQGQMPQQQEADPLSQGIEALKKLLGI